MELIEVPTTEVIDGKVMYNAGADMAGADPSVYGRLVRDGKTKQADKMLNEKGFNVLLDDGEFM